MHLHISDVLLIVISVFIPPLPVMIRRGTLSKDTAINLALLFVGFVPCVIHTWVMLGKLLQSHHPLSRKQPSSNYGAVEEGTV